MRPLVTLSVVLSLLLFNIPSSDTTGKIVGTVVDSKTGEKLLSANVIVEGIKIGGTTNVDGYFAILNVPPGSYTVQASLLGYQSRRFSNVQVNIDQTTTLDFKLAETAVEQQEITVVAERPIVQRDVSQSVASITAVDVEKLPVATITSVVNLQAGIQSNSSGDLVIRGSGGTGQFNGAGTDQAVVLLNGQSLRDGRDNSPYTGINLSAIENVQVLTGGFTAEYGSVRSGLVNVVTKEGNSNKYSFSASGRYSAADPKHFGMSIYDPNSYWIRPYVDPDVAWTGTGSGFEAGAWDKWTRDQYLNFKGWNFLSQQTLADNDPQNDLTPAALQKLFLWQHRKQAEVSKPDYDIDAGFGGPLIPGVSESLGNLRFHVSYRRQQNAYIIPLNTDVYKDDNFQWKLTSDVAEGMKFSVEGLFAKAEGTTDNNTGNQGVFITTTGIVSSLGFSAPNLSGVNYTDSRIFTTDYWAPTTVRRKMFSAKLTHALSNTFYYNVSLSMFQSRYNTAPSRLRDNSRIYKFGNDYYVDEAPFGFQPLPLLQGNYNSSEGVGATPGLRMAVGMSNSRDNSIVTNYTAKLDFTTQLDKYNQVQFGGEFLYVDNDVNYSSVDLQLPSGRSSSQWHTFPKQAGAYVQDKLEFEGMVANLGLRLDYSYAGGEWYQYDPYTQVFSDARSFGLDTNSSIMKEPTKKQVTLSPRLGIAFPISVNSKLFFNYGHYRALPVPENLFLIRRETVSGAILRIADPNLELPKTVAYELGYEHNLFDQYLVRLAGYYKDISNETRLVQYRDPNNSVDYNVSTDIQYRDIRGFETTISKNRGNWIQGFLNYTYNVSSRGYFGFLRYDANPGVQRDYERDLNNVRQTRPIPQPYARANIDFFTPPDFGPGIEGFSLLGDWRVNLIGRWTTGFTFTWDNGLSQPGIENNAQWTDDYNVDMRISKSFNFAGATLQLYADMTNLFNIRRLSGYGFSDVTDYYSYMKSLHLPEGIAGNVVDQKLKYANIPGDDQPGNYRKESVAYQPIVSVNKFAELGSGLQNLQTRPFYYVAERNQYYQLVNNQWQVVDPGKLQQVMDDKAYIDMPNMETFAFLNPRNVFFGIRLSYDF